MKSAGRLSITTLPSSEGWCIRSSNARWRRGRYECVPYPRTQAWRVEAGPPPLRLLFVLYCPHAHAYDRSLYFSFSNPIIVTPKTTTRGSHSYNYKQLWRSQDSSRNAHSRSSLLRWRWYPNCIGRSRQKTSPRPVRQKSISGRP